MNKHIIELRPDCKVVQQICEKDGQIYIGSRGVHYLEELTVDYIKKNGKTQETESRHASKGGADEGDGQIRGKPD